MMKKLAIVAVALAIATPAFAATVTNKGKQLILSVNVANSGVNQTNSKSGKITTGHSAVISDTEASLNTTQIDHSKKLSVKNDGSQLVASANIANSGFNQANKGSVKTGGSFVGSTVVSTMNTTVVGE